MATNFRKRSPRFPSHTLDEAIVYARRIYEAVHRSPIDASTAFEVMGFTGKSGSSATALGSVRQYGLIEGFAENTRISDLALQIFEPATSEEQVRAKRQAAFTPKVFTDISERFSGKVPSVDEPIRAFLIRDLGFSKSGAEECISSLRGTLSSMPHDTETENPTGHQVVTENDLQESQSRLEDPSTESRASGASANESASHLRFPLTKECYAELTILGELTPKAIGNLKKQIDLLSDILEDE